MSFNCENVFDTIHDTGKDDYDFLPDGNRHWGRGRLYKKLKGIMKVIAASDIVRPVDLVGLCEVENDSVLTYLTQHTALHKIGYKYVMTSSSDKRGVDVALLYTPFTFRLLEHASIGIKEQNASMRDILRATGIVESGDTVDVYVCHLPSKLGGKDAEERSKSMTRLLKSDVDSIMTIRSVPYVIIMGDFNAEYNTPQIRDILEAKQVSGKRLQNRVEKCKLVDLITGRKYGTYRYRGQWSVIDHIIVSGTFFDATSSIKTSYQDSGIHRFPFLLEDDDVYGGKKPRRTYNYMKYNGGISDHLPVWARFSFIE